MEALPENSIDAFIDAGNKQADFVKSLAEQNAIRIHKVFQQNEDGRELLAIWRKALIMVPVAGPNSTQIEVGIAEGINKFVRNIIIQVESVEKDYE